MVYMSRLVRTEDSLEKLEELLVQECGDMSAAAREIGVSVASVHFWMQDDPEAEKRLKQAQLIGWSRLESAAYERGVKGVEEAVYYQGAVCGYKTVYSDGLLLAMMKARNPAYRQEQETGPKVVVNLMPRAETYEEWTRMRQETLKQLAPPVEKVEYTEYEPVTESVLRDVL